MKKKECLQRISRRMAAMALAVLMSLSIFAQTLPKVSAVEDVSGSDVAAATEDTEVVTEEIPADENETQSEETIGLAKDTSSSDATLPDTDAPAPAAAVSAADASVAEVSSSDASVSDASASDTSASDVSASDVLSPEFHAEREINDWTVSVYAPEGVIPENAELRITNVNGILRTIAEAVADVEFDILVDVTIYVDGKEIQPDTENGLVQISLTKDGNVSGAFEIYHFNETVSNVEILDTEICGDTATAELEHFSLIGGDDSIKTWTAFAAAVNAAASGDEIKLDGDIVRDDDASAITLTKNLTIDLNGHKLSSTCAMKNGGNLFTVTSGKLEVKNGTIDGFANDGHGGAFYVTGGRLDINKATIQNCSAHDSGGAVCNKGATVYIYDSVIKNCTANGNSAPSFYDVPGGGGLFGNAGSYFQLSETTITGCKSNIVGGGIAFSGNAKMSSYGNSIYGNTAAFEGGGAYIQTESQIILDIGPTYIYNNRSNDKSEYNDVWIDHASSTTNVDVIHHNNGLDSGCKIYIGTSTPRPFCNSNKDLAYMYTSNCSGKVIRDGNYKNTLFGLVLVEGQRIIVDPALKNGDITVNPVDGDGNKDFVGTDGVGKTVTITVTPASCYELDKLYYVKYGTTDKVDITTYDEAKKTYSFSMPDNDVTIYATFNATLLKVGDSFYTAQDGSKPSPYEGALKFIVTDAAKKTVSIEAGSSSPVGALSIPEKVTGTDGIEYSVTSFGEYAFFGSEITSVTIPGSITSIGESVFDCCKLTSVTIPSSVKSIEAYAFHGCSSLTSVTIPNSVESIGNNAFNGCSSLTSVTIPSSVKSIGMSAFNGCSITSLIIQSSGSEFNKYCFRGIGKATSPTKLVLPSGWNGTAWVNSTTLWYAGYFALAKNVTVAECKNGKAEVDMTAALKDETVTVTVTPDTGYVLDKLTYKAGTADPVAIAQVSGKYTFAMPDSDVTVSATFKAKPDGSKENPWLIGKNNPSDVTAYFDSTTKTLTIEGTGATKDWTSSAKPEWADSGVKNVVVKSGVTALGNSAFDTNRSITAVDLGGVTEIGTQAFYNTSNLKNVTANSLEKIGYWAFARSGIESISLPNVTTADIKAFESCTKLKSASLPKLADIPEECFYYCNALEAYDFSKVTSVGKSAFYSCNALTSIDIPGNTAIGEDAFRSSTGVKSVSIPNVTTMGNAAFASIGSYNTPTEAQKFSITLSPELTELPMMCFSQVKCLNKVVYTSASMPKIGDYAFMNVTADVYIPASWLSDTLTLEALNKRGADSGLYQYGALQLTYHACYTVNTAAAANGSVSSDKDLAEPGETVTVTVTPDTGYRLDKLTYKTGTADPVEIPETSGKYTFEMPAGNVTVYATFKQNHVHTWKYDVMGVTTIKAYCTDADCPNEYTQNKNPLYVTMSALSADYTGEPYAALSINNTITPVIGETLTVTYRGDSDTTYAESETPPTDLGTYIVKASIAGKSIEQRFWIMKPDQELSCGKVTMEIGETGKKLEPKHTVGDGAISYKVNKAGLSVDKDGNLTATAAGTYKVTVTAAETEKYAAANVIVTVTVTKKTQTITVPNDTITVTYGTPVSIGASANDSATLTYVNNATDYFTVDSTGKVTFVKADSSGTMTVTVKAAATDTYAAAEKTVYVKTEKAVLALMFDDSDPNDAYAGETAADALARISGKVTGFVNNDTQDAVGTMAKNIRNGSGSSLASTDELLTDGTYKYVLQFTLNSAKAECYTMDPSVLVRDTAITVSKRDQTVTPAQETVYVKVGDSASVRATASETQITSLPVLSSDKLGTVTYTIKGTSSIVTAVDKGTGALTLSGDEGSATIVATAAGNKYYNAATAEITVVVTKKLDPEPEISYSETIYMGETDKTVSVNTESKGTVTISISDGKSISLTPASDGKTADVTTLEPGATKIHVEIAETDEYASFEGDYDIEVKKRDQTVTADNITFYTGEKKSVSATVAETPISGVTALTGQTGALSYEVKSGTGDAVTVDKTTGELTFVKAGTATVTITADANDTYNTQTKDITVTVNKRTQAVKADDMTIAATDSGTKINPIVSEVAVSGVPSLSGKTAKPVFKSSDESIATVDENGVITVNKPGKVTISMTLPGNDFYNEVTAPTDITLTIDPLTVIEGDGGKYKVGSKEGLTFRSNGNYDNFIGVQVDDEDVDASNYTAWEGSTYVKFTTKYLNSLTTGKHKLTYLFKNGKCSAYFYVVRPSRGGGNGYSPKTGDEVNVILWINLNVLSMIVIAAVVIDRRKRRYSIGK